MIISMGDGAS